MKSQVRKLQTKKNSGFTLIELMIVVAIVAILAAVAIPAYQDYLIRSKVSEVAAAAGACKTSVAEYYAANAAMPGTVTSAGCNVTPTQYAGATAVAAGVITVPSVIPNAGGNVVLTPGLTGTEITSWACTGTIQAKYLPASCR